jgi:hypothetical protein
MDLMWLWTAFGLGPQSSPQKSTCRGWSWWNLVRRDCRTAVSGTVFTKCWTDCYLRRSHFKILVTSGESNLQQPWPWSF